MFENYAFALTLLIFAWVVGNTLNRLFEGVSAEKSPGCCFSKFGCDIDEKYGREESSESLSVTPHTVLGGGGSLKP